MRFILERYLFIAVPLGLYAGYLIAQLINPKRFDRGRQRILLLVTLAGALVAVGGLVVSGLFADRFSGAYRPAHVENGRITSGQGTEDAK